MTDSISAASAAATGNTDSASSLTRLSGDYNSFLKLLTAQVQNQDPLAPMDSSTFVTQLAQLSQVEQAVKSNDNLESILAKLGASGAMSDVQLIGREVMLPGDRLAGEGAFAYELGKPADQVSAVITDTNGRVVRRLDGLATGSGVRHSVDWDGLDTTGKDATGGPFRVEILAAVASGEVVPYSEYVMSEVKGLTFEDGSGKLEMANGTLADSSQVLAVR